MSRTVVFFPDLDLLPDNRPKEVLPKDVLFTFEVDKVTISTFAGEGRKITLAFTFAADPNDEPAQINLHFQDNVLLSEDFARLPPVLYPLTHPDVLGTYKRSADSLNLCIGRAYPMQRPKTLFPGGDSEAVMYQLVRVKKD